MSVRALSASPDLTLTSFYRPLPDERPRQSVANLIGRFEQQGKRQAPPAVPVVPRSSSVSSQIAGDAVKEEIKEKREWPPKPAASADIKQLVPTLAGSPSASMSKSPVMSPQPIPDLPPPADVPTTPTPASPEPVRSPPSKGKGVAAGKSTPTGKRHAVASPAKVRSPATKSSSSPPSKTSLQSSVSQPLRPQHTGHSVTSNPSTTRQSRSVPRTAPSTPSRPKSSSGQHQGRPKTPSSGLFAPTAASLARSRNAPPPPPPPVKKATLSSDAAERLSKPTAASLSKARTPVSTAPSPARVVKSTSAGAPGLIPRGFSKLKVGRTPAKAKDANTKEGIKSAPASVASEPSEPSRDSDQLVADPVENGHESGIATFSDVGSPEDAHGHSEVINDVAHDPVADEDVHPDSGDHPQQQAGDHPAEEVHSHEHVAQNLPEDEGAGAHEHGQIRLEVHDDTVPEPAESHVDQVISNGDGHNVELAAPGNEIEDIVNMLEGASISKTRPQSIVTIPDEDGEIQY